MIAWFKGLETELEQGNAVSFCSENKDKAYPWPPVLGGAPVSPSAIARAVVEKAAVRMGRRAAVLAKVVRSIVGGGRIDVMGGWQDG